jgi:hypothetical protein
MAGIEEKLKVTRSTLEALYNWSTEASDKAARQEDENTARYRNARTEVIDSVLKKEIDALQKKSKLRFDLERRHLEEVRSKIDEIYGKEIDKLSEIDRKKRAATLEGIKVREKEINTAEKMDILGKKGGPIQSIFGALGLPQLGSVAMGSAKSGEVLGALTGTVGAFTGALAGMSIPTTALAFFGESLKEYGNVLKESGQVFKALSGGMSNLQFSFDHSGEAAKNLNNELRDFSIKFGSEAKQDVLEAMSSLSAGLFRHQGDIAGANEKIFQFAQIALKAGAMIGMSAKQYADALSELRNKYNVTETDAINIMALFAKGVGAAGGRFSVFWNALQSVEGRLRPLGFTIADTSARLVSLTRAIDAGIISAEDFSKALSAPQEVPEDAMAFMINQIIQGAGGEKARPLREDLERYQGNLLMQMEVFRAASGGLRQDPRTGRVVEDQQARQMALAIKELLPEMAQKIGGPATGEAGGTFGRLAIDRFFGSIFQPGVFDRNMATRQLMRREELSGIAGGVVPSDPLVGLTQVGSKASTTIGKMETTFGTTHEELIKFKNDMGIAGEKILEGIVTPAEQFGNWWKVFFGETIPTLIWYKNLIGSYQPEGAVVPMPGQDWSGSPRGRSGGSETLIR